MIGSNPGLIKTNWSGCLKQSAFKYLLFTGLAILIVMLSLLPSFFHFIESRPGYVLNDWLLNQIKPRNVSVPIFIFIWTSVAFILLSVIKKPEALLQFLYAYIFLMLLRYISIYFFPLEAPANLVVLADPLSNSFYGTTFITKDLFFSGHTSSLFLIYLFQTNKVVKAYTLLASLFVGVLVLVQHVHYTVDVVVAYPAAYLCYMVSNQLIKYFLL